MHHSLVQPCSNFGQKKGKEMEQLDFIGKFPDGEIRKTKLRECIFRKLLEKGYFCKW